jgi:putative transposase
MPAPLSLDLRQRIVQAVKRGCSMREAARRFDVAPSTAIKLMHRVQATGSTAPDRYGGHRRPLLERFGHLLEALVLATPDITLAELQRAVEQRVGIRVGLSTLHNALHRQGLRHKKSP